MNLIAKTIKLLGGYTRDEVLNEAVSDLYNTISSKDILRVEDGDYWFQDRTLSKPELDLIKAEAQNFLQTKLWKILTNEIKYQSNKVMFLKCQGKEDLIVGKSWLYVLNEIEKKLIELTNSSR